MWVRQLTSFLLSLHIKIFQEFDTFGKSEFILPHNVCIQILEFSISVYSLVMLQNKVFFIQINKILLWVMVNKLILNPSVAI